MESILTCVIVDAHVLTLELKYFDIIVGYTFMNITLSLKWCFRGIYKVRLEIITLRRSRPQMTLRNFHPQILHCRSILPR